MIKNEIQTKLDDGNYIYCTKCGILIKPKELYVFKALVGYFHKSCPENPQTKGKG